MARVVKMDSEISAGVQRWQAADDSRIHFRVHLRIPDGWLLVEVQSDDVMIYRQVGWYPHYVLSLGEEETSHTWEK